MTPALSLSKGGLTLVECLLALTILAGAFLAAVSTATAGHQHLRAGDREFQGVRMARDLLEEIISRSYTDPNGTTVFGPDPGEALRRDFDDVDDYHNLNEAVGQLRDLSGTLYPAIYQIVSRRVTVVADTASIAALGLNNVQGMTVTVIVTDPKGKTWNFTRFVPKPVR